MITSPFADSGLWQLMGWSMLHLSWIGILIGASALLARALIRKMSPQVRYAVALGWLTLLAIAPLPVGWWGLSTRPDSTNVSIEPEYPAATVTETTIASIDETLAKSLASSTFTPTETDRKSSRIVAPKVGQSTERQKLNTIPSKSHEPAESFVVKPSTAVLDSEWPSSPRPPTAGSAELFEGTSPHLATNEENRLMDYVATQLDAVADTLPWLWFIGTPATFLLLATGLLGAEKLRRQSQPMVDDALNAPLARFSAQLGLRAKVAVGICDRIAGPILVGIVRPIILLPAAAVCQWTPDQLEMVLWHELSHIRRWDNLVNLLQRIVESLLFFVPAVWLVSRWVRLEREHCCDRCVVAQTGKPREYAQTLVQIADRRLAPGTRKRATVSKLLTSPMAEHVLLVRVRQILKSEEEPMKISRTLFGSVVLAFAALTMLIGWYGIGSIKAQEEGNPSAAEQAPDDSNSVESNDDAKKEALPKFEKKVEKNEKSLEREEPASTSESAVHSVSGDEIKLAPPPKVEASKKSEEPVRRRKRVKEDVPTKASHEFAVRFLDDTTISSDRMRVLESLTVQPGDIVQRGDELARFSQDEIEKAKTEFSIAKVKVDTARREYEEHKTLAEKGAASSKELASLKAELELAELHLKMEVLKLDSVAKPLVSPIAGTIVEFYKRAGETVKPGDPIVRIVNTDRFAVEGNVSISENSPPKRGDSFRLTICTQWRDGKPVAFESFSGKVDFVGNEVQQLSYAVVVRGTVENREGILRAGMRGTVEFGDAKEPELEVEQDAEIIRGAELTQKVFGALLMDEVSRDEPQYARQFANSQHRGGITIERVDPNGPAGRNGIRDGDILVGLAKWETVSFKNLSWVLLHSDLKAFEPLKFYILRNGETLFGQMRPDRRYMEDWEYDRWSKGQSKGDTRVRTNGDDKQPKIEEKKTEKTKPAKGNDKSSDDAAKLEPRVGDKSENDAESKLSKLSPEQQTQRILAMLGIQSLTELHRESRDLPSNRRSEDGKLQIVTDNPVELRGLKVVGVDPNGPAGKAGIREGDLLIGFLSKVTNDLQSLNLQFQDLEFKAGTNLDFLLLRGNDRWWGHLKLDENYDYDAWLSNLRKAEEAKDGEKKAE